MRDNASTVAFEHRVEVSGDRMNYSETTSLDIYGEALAERIARPQIERELLRRCLVVLVHPFGSPDDLAQ